MRVTSQGHTELQTCMRCVVTGCYVMSQCGSSFDQHLLHCTPALFLQVEIYCERLKDLLNLDAAPDDLAVQCDSAHGYHVGGAVKHRARSAGEMMAVINTGLSNRVRCCSCLSLQGALLAFAAVLRKEVAILLQQQLNHKHLVLIRQACRRAASVQC